MRQCLCLSELSFIIDDTTVRKFRVSHMVMIEDVTIVDLVRANLQNLV